MYNARASLREFEIIFHTLCMLLKLINSFSALAVVNFANAMPLQKAFRGKAQKARLYSCLG